MKGKTLKELAKRLDLSVRVLNGIMKGEKRSGGDIMNSNMAKCLGVIATRTGYKTKERATEAIEGTIRQLYISADKLKQGIQRMLRNCAKWAKPILEQALIYLSANNLKGYSKLISQNPKLQGLQYKTATKVSSSLIEQYRQGKQNRSRAKALTGDKKILTKESSIQSEVKKRLKRWLVTASMFYEAAIKFQPNVKVKGLTAMRKKVREKTKGASVSVKFKSGKMTANVIHHVEKKNKTYKKKLKKTIKDAEKHWGKQIEKEIMAYMALDKFLGK